MIAIAICTQVFLTPGGRFGLKLILSSIGSSAPKLFQREMMKIIHSLKRVLCIIDDVIALGFTPANSRIEGKRS